MTQVAHGIYEALLDEYLRDALAQHPELRAVFGKIDPEEQPARLLIVVRQKHDRLYTHWDVCREEWYIP